MNKKQAMRRQVERTFTTALIISAIFFTIFLIAAGNGIIWLKVICAILTILISFLCLSLLYLRHELFRPDRIWMTVAAGSLIICTLFSLILGFPCPYPQ